ncbi:MAG: hypothetical protein ACKVQS_00770 [Fimbriimonadaceae bacterium]
MIFLKHSILLTVLFVCLPLLARILINRINRRVGFANVPIDIPFLIQCLCLGIVFPLAANGGWAFFTSMGMQGQVARYVSLGLIGGMYGWFYALQDYVYNWPAILLGLGGGILTAFLYTVIPFNILTLALFATTLTVLPLLALEFPQGPIGRIIRAGQSLLPIRGVLR